jgi:two-component system chemotaxis response regulator CheY
MKPAATIDPEEDLIHGYLGEYADHLASIKADLLAVGDGAHASDASLLIGRVFRAIHAVRGAGFFGLVKIGDLAQRMEEVLAPDRARGSVPNPGRVRVLLRAAARLNLLIEQPDQSNRGDIAAEMNALSPLRELPESAPNLGAGQLRVLLVEDDPASRTLLHTFLSRHGECDFALNGREGVEACRAALEGGRMYHLICMDIMMPEMDGREALREIRALEDASGVVSGSGAKIIMITAVDDMKQVIRCFEEFCDAYLMKPLSLAQLLRHMKSYRLIR